MRTSPRRTGTTQREKKRRVPSSIKLSSGSSEEALTLGIRKTGLDLETATSPLLTGESCSSVPLITPTSPTKFFQRLSPRRRNQSSYQKMKQDNQRPLGIARNPFRGEGLDETAFDLDNSNSNDSESSTSTHSDLDQIPAMTPIALDSSESSNTEEEQQHRASKETSTDTGIQKTEPHRNLHSASSEPIAPISPPKAKRVDTDIPLLVKHSPERAIIKASLSEEHNATRTGTHVDMDIGKELHTNKDTGTGTIPQGTKETRNLRVKDSQILWSKAKKKKQQERQQQQHKIKLEAAAAANDPVIKIFLLLLQPNAKIFELIQLLYPASTTTIGDIIGLIPSNATEKELGAQKYVGICRPKKRSPEITNVEQLASHPTDETSAKIVYGEVFVAIPHGFTAKHVVALSKQILSNPKIQTLLTKSSSKQNRVRSAKTAKHKTTHSNEKGRSSSSARQKVTRQVLKEDQVRISPNIEEKIKRARYAASISNMDAIQESDRGVPRELLHALNALPDDGSTNSSLGNSLTSFTSQRSYTSQRSLKSRSQAVCGGNYEEDSLQGSYSSWSKSFDSSIAASRLKRQSMANTTRSSRLESTTAVSESITSTTVPLTPRRRRRRAKNAATLRRLAAASFVYMCIHYIMDQGLHHESGYYREVLTEPLGWTGFFALVVTFAGLLKWQRTFQQAASNGGRVGTPAWQLTPPRRHSDHPNPTQVQMW